MILILPNTEEVINTKEMYRLGRLEYHNDRVCFNIHFKDGTHLEVGEYLPEPSNLEGQKLKEWIAYNHADVVSKAVGLKSTLHFVLNYDDKLKK